jgi:hypothetical protein
LTKSNRGPRIPVAVGASVGWTIVKALAEVVVALGGVAVFTLIVKPAIEGWIRSTFDRKLSVYQHELDKRLEDYKLGPAALLALFTQRTGVLSQVQLKAVRRMWARAVDVYIDVLNLTEPIRVFTAKTDTEIARKIFATNRDAANLLEKERAFLPEDLYKMAVEYLNLVRTTLHEVVEKAEVRECGENRQWQAAEIKALRERINAHRVEIGKAYEDLGEKIRKLTAPKLPGA